MSNEHRTFRLSSNEPHRRHLILRVFPMENERTVKIQVRDVARHFVPRLHAGQRLYACLGQESSDRKRSRIPRIIAEAVEMNIA